MTVIKTTREINSDTEKLEHMIVASYAGTGKTTLAKTLPQRFVDFVCMPYKYLLEPNNNCGESCKANPNNIMQDEWPYNYVSAISEALNSDKILLIPTDLYVLALLREKKIPYFLCYPCRHAKDNYLGRFLDRGNTTDFIDVFIGRWDNFIDAFEHDSYGKHIVLQPDQFLSDAIGDFFNI